MYELESIVFTGNCLTSIGAVSFQYAKNKLKQIIFPPSLSEIGKGALGGIEKLENLYYCNSKAITNKVFYVPGTSGTPQTNKNLKIHVIKNYNGDEFGERTNLKKDAESTCSKFSNECIFPQSLYFFKTCYVARKTILLFIVYYLIIFIK